MCVIGAGSSGIAACQVLHARGIPFECFEKGSQVGGNWRYMNDNGMSAAYRSLHINTSRGLMAYATYPMPKDYPDYPNHEQIAAYFDARYVRSPRHTIQVDFYPYMRTLRRERRRVRRGSLAGLRARRSHELRLGSPSG